VTARVALVAFSLALSVTRSARAQDDDWAITRSPPTRTHARPAPHPRSTESTSDRLIDRYRAMVERNPSEHFALTRWVTLVIARDGSPDALTTEMRAARTNDPAAIVPRLVLTELAERTGRIDEARALIAEIVSAHPEDALGYAARARLELGAHSPAAARDAYEAARARASGDDARALAQAELDVLVDLGDVPAATSLDAQLAGARPSVERRLELPRAWLAHQRPEAALEAIEALEPRVAGDARARITVRMARARAELALGRVADAASSLDSVLARARGGVRAEALALAYDAHRQAGTLDALASALDHDHDAEAMALRARIEDERGHDEAALEAYDRALHAHRADTDLAVQRAHLLLRMGRVDEAASALEAVWRAAPDHPDRLIEAATLLVDAGRSTDAQALLRRASIARPHDAPLHARLAEVLARWDDADGALAEARRLAELEPSDPEHRALIGDLLLARGDRAGALAAFRSMTTIDSSAAGHDRLGLVLADHDLLDDARVALEAARTLAPDDRSILRHLVDVLSRAGRDADAEPIAGRILDLSVGDAAAEREARAALVAIWARRRTLDRHVHALDTELAASPSDRATAMLLAEALRRSGQTARADDVLSRITAHAPDDAEVWTAIERVRTLRGDLTGAIDALEHAASADPSRAAIDYARMSEHALALYRDDDAVRYAARAIELAPDDPHGHVRLGDLERRRQHDEAAATSYRRALALDPDLHDVALVLATLTRRAGDSEAADTLCAHVIEASPDDDLVSRAIDTSLEVELARGDAEPLLDRLVGLSLAHFDRPIFTHAALTVLDVVASPLLPRAHADDPDARAIIERIASRGLGVLLRALGSTDPSEQRTALSILEAARVEAAAPALLALASHHDDGALGVDAMLAAARIAPASALPRLLEVANGSEPTRARIAAWGIARIGGPLATHALVTLLGTHGEVSLVAAIGLAHLHATSAARDIEAIDAHEGSIVRHAVFTLTLAALGHAPTIQACASLHEVAGAPRSIALLTCEAPTNVAAALLSTLDAESGTRAMRHRPDDLAAAWPEPRSGEPTASLALRAIDLAPAHDASAGLGAAIAHDVLDGLHASTPLTTLRQLTVRDGHLVLVHAADDALLDAARTALTLALPTTAGDETTRAAAARVLAEISPEDPRVPTLLADERPAVVRATLQGIAAAPMVPTTLDRALGDLAIRSEDWVVRVDAVRALGRLTDGSDGALTAALSSDPFAFVREAAAIALAGHSAPSAAAALRSAADGDPDERVRTAASAALR
jgi:tetratricopeptide (TPR) repeat protein